MPFKSGLMARDESQDNASVITRSGFQFLLMDRSSQVYHFLTSDNWPNSIYHFYLTAHLQPTAGVWLWPEFAECFRLPGFLSRPRQSNSRVEIIRGKSIIDANDRE